MNILTKRCACDPGAAERTPRGLLTRLLPGVRAYVCGTCGERFLASKRLIDEAKTTQRLSMFSGQGTDL